MASIRDLTCIRSVSHMAEYGKYEEEFIVYGCSCLEKGRVVYRISPYYSEIAQFVSQSIQQKRYASPVQMMTRRSIVHTGQHEQLLYETELSLAQILQQSYPRHFFAEVEQCMQSTADDSAKPIFDKLRMQMNGIFFADYLQLFEGLADLAYRAGNLTDNAWNEIQDWLRKMRIQMEYDIVAKKPFVRTFYGICYIDSNGRYQYKANAQEYIILEEQRKLKRRNIPVTPIFQKTYWYDYGVEPKTIREQFKKELMVYYDALYWQHWKMLRALPPIVPEKQYQQALECVRQQDPKESVEAFLEYGYNWNLR